MPVIFPLLPGIGTLKDQYIPIPVPSAPGVSPDKTMRLQANHRLTAK